MSMIPHSIKSDLVSIIKLHGRKAAYDYAQRRIEFWKCRDSKHAKRWEETVEELDLNLCDLAYREANRN